jgi:hypothetical protein
MKVTKLSPGYLAKTDPVPDTFRPVPTTPMSELYMLMLVRTDPKDPTYPRSRAQEAPKQKIWETSVPLYIFCVSLSEGLFLSSLFCSSAVPHSRINHLFNFHNNDGDDIFFDHVR